MSHAPTRYLRTDRLVTAWRTDLDERDNDHGESLIFTAMIAWIIGAFSGFTSAFTIAVLGAACFVLGDSGGPERAVFAVVAAILVVVTAASWSVVLVVRERAFDLVLGADGWATTDAAAWAYRILHTEGEGELADGLRDDLEGLDAAAQARHTSHSLLLELADATD